MGADNGASERFHLGSLVREDRPKPFEFDTTDGQVFTLPDPEDLGIATVARLDGANPVEIMEMLLGDRWDAFLKADPEMWRLGELLAQWGTHYGIDLGESSASPPSSNRAVRRSRPTSEKRTGSGSPISQPVT